MKAKSLRVLRERLGDCRRCKLAQSRQTIVFGEGDPEARVMFVGEGPGADEDAQGRPFVGRAGKLLDRMIEAMHLRRQDVYIANTIKCRPPENRDPETDETAACRPFLVDQISAIRPRAIVALGNAALHWFFPEAEGIMKERGRWRQWSAPAAPDDLVIVDVMPTFHPAFLLREPAAKRTTWRDLVAVMRVLGIPV